MLDLKTQKIVWDIPASERVFFLGKDAADLDVIEFKDRKIKNLTKEEGEEMSDFSDPEDNEDGPALVLRDEEKEDLSGIDEMDHEDKLQRIHKGIMVI